jgi:hypothetical protein
MALPDGSALVMGGNTSESINVPDAASSQRFDPGLERFVAGPPLAFSALDTFFTVALPLSNGFLLAGGGINSGAGAGAPSTRLSQTFDPAGQHFARAGDLRINHSGSGVGTALADGRVLMTGGGTPAIRNTEIYDPRTRAWTQAAPMVAGRRSHTATLLHDGRVLLAGGLQCCAVEGQTVRETFATSAELFDPRTGEFTATGSLGVGRAFHRATLLVDGRVLISGGLGDASPPGTEDLLARTEVYDPATGQFTQAGALQVSRALHTATISPTAGRRAGGPRNATRPPGPHRDLDPGEPLSDGPTSPGLVRWTATLLGNGRSSSLAARRRPNSRPQRLPLRVTVDALSSAA